MPTKRSHARPLAVVDVLLFTVRDFWERAGETPRLEIALTRRIKEPFAGALALPGTVMRVDPDETTGEVDWTDLDAARRVLRDRLGVEAPHLEQLYTWFNRDVDPRGPTIVIGYFAVVPFQHFKKADSVTFVPVDELPDLAFNHAAMIAKGVERVQGKAVYSTLPALLLPDYFTLRELQSAYEAVTGKTYDASNFKKLMLSLDVIELVETESWKTKQARERGAPMVGRRPLIFRLRERSRLTTFPKTAF